MDPSRFFMIRPLLTEFLQRIPCPLSLLMKMLSREDVDKCVDKCKFDVLVEARRGYFVGMQRR